MKKFTLLSLLLLFFGVTMRAQDELILTFNRPGGATSPADVEVLVNGTVRSGATFESNQPSLRNGVHVINDIICPDVNVGNGGTSTMTFTIPGLTAGAVYNNVCLKVHALNGNNTHQYSPRNVIINIKKGTTDDAEDFCTLTGTMVENGDTGASPTDFESGIQAATAFTVPDNGTLVVKLVITRGETNGFYVGLEEIRLIAPLGLSAAIDAAIDNAEGVLAAHQDQPGYPKESYCTALETAISNCQTTPSEDNLAALQTAYNNYLTTTDVQIPEVGKYYKIVSNYSGFNTTTKAMVSDFRGTEQDLLFADLDETKNKFIWMVEADGENLKLRNANGLYVNSSGNVGNSSDPGVLTMITDKATAKNVTFTRIAFGIFNINIGGSNDLHTDTNQGFIVAWNDDAATSKSAWRIEEVTTVGKKYPVTVSGLPAAIAIHGYAARTATSEATYNGGFFFTADDGTLPTNEVTAADVPGFSGGVSPSGENFAVSYAVNDEAYGPLLANTIADAKELRDIRGVGYPTTESQTYENLGTAIKTAEGAAAPFAGTEILNLEDAMATYEASTEGIQLPEAGKAYWFANNGRTTNQAMYIRDADNGSLDLHSATLDDANKGNIRFCWIVEQDNGLKLVSGDGIYVKGDLEVSTNKADAGDVVFHGMGYGKIGFTCGGGAHAHIAQGGNIIKYNNAAASFWIIEEVPYLNNIKVSAQIGDEYVGTFSAPFATTVPAGVEAYTITGKNDNGYAVLSEQPLTAGTVIPANEGVLLVSQTEKTDAYTLPTTATATESLFTNNLLEAGTGAAVDAATTAYILAAGGESVGFYQLNDDDRIVARGKAYLAGLQSGAVVKLNFGGNLTGIDAVDNGELTIDNAPVYDLSGRVVANPTKGGVYIKNGKKFIVK